MASNTTVKIAAMGNAWTPTIIEELTAMYEPLHATRKEEATRRIEVQKNVKYGPSDRNRLDTKIFYPNSEGNVGEAPFHTIVFLHSGGFRNGDTSVSPSMFDNIGYYFAQNKCICALMTYRLLPEAIYPSGAADVVMALKWLGAEVPKLGGDKNDIVAIGHSAGGAHLASAILENFLEDANVKLRGSVLLSVPLYYDLTKPKRRAAMMEYHQTDKEEDVMAKTAVEILKSEASEAFGSKEILLLISELDTDEIARAYFLFVEEYRRKYKRFPPFEVIKGHNHLTTAYAVGLEDDFVGPRVLKFISQMK